MPLAIPQQFQSVLPVASSPATASIVRDHYAQTATRHVPDGWSVISAKPVLPVDMEDLGQYFRTLRPNLDLFQAKQLAEFSENLAKNRNARRLPSFSETSKIVALKRPNLQVDRQVTLAALDNLKTLPQNWDGYTAIPIDTRVIRAAKEFILALVGDNVPTPAVVPMTMGRLQFEWHQGNRSLEIEFETSDQIRFLKWDSDVNIEEEDVISVTNTDTIHDLLRWFAPEPMNVRTQ